MTVSLKKHPTAPRTYTHPGTGTLLAVSDSKVDAWPSEGGWVSGDDPAWSAPTLKAAREKLAGEPAGGPLRFTLEVEVTARSNDRSTLARVLEFISDAAMQDPTVRIVRAEGKKYRA